MPGAPSALEFTDGAGGEPVAFVKVPHTRELRVHSGSFSNANGTSFLPACGRGREALRSSAAALPSAPAGASLLDAVLRASPKDRGALSIFFGKVGAPSTTVLRLDGHTVRVQAGTLVFQGVDLRELCRSSGPE